MRLLIKIFIAAMILYPASVLGATAVVQIDTGTEKVNALEATLVLPVGMRVGQIETGTSAILIWVTPPRLGTREIAFAGITPGGFSGMQTIFTLEGEFENSALEQVGFKDILALKSDGSGGNTPVTLSVVPGESKRDTELPEDFILATAKDQDVFDGKMFLVFATQDKGSGIAHYCVREGLFGSCEAAESPFVLRNQDADGLIAVEAVDFEGNTRTAYLYTPAAKMRYSLYAILGILIFVSTVFAFLRGRSAFSRT